MSPIVLPLAPTARTREPLSGRAVTASTATHLRHRFRAGRLHLRGQAHARKDGRGDPCAAALSVHLRAHEGPAGHLGHRWR